MLVDKYGYVIGGYVIDDNEGGEEKDGCLAGGWRFLGGVGGQRHVGGGEHEFLIISSARGFDREGFVLPRCLAQPCSPSQLPSHSPSHR